MKLVLDGNSLTIKDVYNYAFCKDGEITISLSKESERVLDRKYKKLLTILNKKTVYGTNTGVGVFNNKLIVEKNDLFKLQKNIIKSHAAGVGEYFDKSIVKAAILIRANSLCKGYSGVRPDLVKFLLKMLNSNIYPRVPSIGSLGASGDLVPLAHIGLVMIGEGEAEYNGKIYPGKIALDKGGLKPFEFYPKEALALINGTSFMGALASLAVYRAERLKYMANLCASITMEALGSHIEQFNLNLHRVRPYSEIMEISKEILNILKDSYLVNFNSQKNIQDAYSVRCIPQVHGAVLMAINHAKRNVEIEINSSDDNPLFFEKNKNLLVLHGGNFHGEPIALSMNYLSIALSEIGGISECRISHLLVPDYYRDNFPMFITERGGINSGYMIAHTTASALCAENRVLANPCSTDNIPTVGNVEDHHSMGLLAAKNCNKILDNLEDILSIELLSAIRFIDLYNSNNKKKLKLSSITMEIYKKIRKAIPFVKDDSTIYDKITKVKKLMRNEILRSK